MSLNAKWFLGFKPTPELTKGDYESTIRNSRYVLDILTNIIQSELRDTDLNGTDQYDKASWPYYMADKNGYRRALSNLLKVVKLEPKDV